MIERKRISLSQVIQDAGCNGLLTDPQVHLARDLAFLPQFGHSLLKQATAEHLSVQAPKIRFHAFLL